MADFNGFSVCADKDACKLKKFGDDNQRRKTATWKMSVPKETAKELLKEDSRIFLGMKSIKVDLWSPGHKRCVRCFSNNHKANNLEACKKTICNLCAGDHEAKECRKKDRPDQHKCYVCEVNQKSDYKHQATVRDCPILRKEAEEEATKATAHIYG